MKRMRGIASGVVAAPAEQCLELLAAIDGYPSWHPGVVRGVIVLERDDQGRPTKARATLHVSLGPLTKDLELVLAVDVARPSTVELRRLPGDPSDKDEFVATWRLLAGAGTRIELELRASLDVPRLVPVGRIGEAMAADFVAAASRALQPGRP